MSLSSEFKEFISKGNVMDLAVGVIIGGAFGKIVSSLVDQVVMPIVGLVAGGNPFEKLKITLKDTGNPDTDVVMNLGAFLGEILNFLIIAFVIFLMIKAVNTMRSRLEKPKAVEPEAPKGPTQEELLSEIRDLLKSNT